MEFPLDSPLRLATVGLALAFVLAFVLAGPACAAKARKPTATAKAAAAVEPQPDPALLITQARDAAGRGETDLALRMAQAAIVADPASPAAYDALGDVYAASRQPDYARDYYDEALSVDPTDPPAQKAIAALARSGDTRAAEATSPAP